MNQNLTNLTLKVIKKIKQDLKQGCAAAFLKTLEESTEMRNIKSQIRRESTKTPFSTKKNQNHESVEHVLQRTSPSKQNHLIHCIIGNRYNWVIARHSASNCLQSWRVWEQPCCDSRHDNLQHDTLPLKSKDPLCSCTCV